VSLSRGLPTNKVVRY